MLAQYNKNTSKINVFKSKAELEVKAFTSSHARNFQVWMIPSKKYVPL